MKEKEIRYPNGILLNLYKHIDVAKYTDDLNDRYADLNTKVALGNFDRLRFYPIDDFTDFRKQSRTGHLWTGGRRDIMLFSLAESDKEKSFRFSFEESSIETDQRDKPYKDIRPWEIEMLREGKPSPRNFISVSMLYLSGKVKNLGLPYKELISLCKDRIAKIVDKVNTIRKDNEIIFEVFGSLNSAELAILWGSNEYVDIQYIVDQLRHLQLRWGDRRHRVFYSSYTIAAIYDRTKELVGIQGGSMIQFATSTKTDSVDSSGKQGSAALYAAAVDYIREETKKMEESHSLSSGEVYSCAGEYDHIYNGEVPVLNSLLRLNGEHQAFNDRNHDFQKHFSSTTTRLYYQEEDVEAVAAALKPELNELLLIKPEQPKPVAAEAQPDLSMEWDEMPKVFQGRRKDEVRQLYEDYKRKLKKLLNSFVVDTTPYSGLSPANYLYNLDLLFCDYVQCVSTMPDLQWAKDFEYQFSSALELLNETLPTQNALIHDAANPISASGLGNSSELDSYFLDAHEILSVLRYNIHHMSDAGKLFFEEPSAHSESTGQYDLIIHTYYGIIKTVLTEVTKNSKYLNEKPTPLVPILRFFDSPIIKSKLYYGGFDGTKLKKKIVDIRIPYDACGEVGLYSPLLIHEIYHYVPPVNRAVRNRTFAVILLSELFADRLQSILAEQKDILKVDIDTDTAVHDLCLKFRELFISALVCSTDFLVDIQTYTSNNTWDTFSENLLFWIKNFNLDKTENDNFSFVYFFCDILADVYCGLKKWCEEDANGEAMTDLVNRLSEVFASSKEYVLELFTTRYPTQEMQKAAGKCLLYRVCLCDKGFYDNVAQELRELLPDFAMVHFSGITELSDYLLLIAVIVDKRYSKTTAVHNQGFLFFRICFIADWLLHGSGTSAENLEEKLDQCEESFCTKYSAYRSLGLDLEIFDEGYTYEREASAWFDYFRSCLLNRNEIYDFYRPFLRQLAEEQFAPGMQEDQETVWDTLKTPLAALTPDKRNLFQAELDLIRAFQPQRFLSEFEALYQEPKPTGSEGPMPPVPQFIPYRYLEYRVENALETAFAIRSATAMLQEYHRRAFGEQSRAKLWFRGCKSSAYPILPSIMVHFLDRDKSCPNGKNYIGTLVEYQRSLLEEFKYRADGASEFINASSYTTADYIALMQHYSQQTCYVDWSDDVYSSLYFALEDEIKESLEVIKSQGKKASDASMNSETTKKDEPDPVLYLFDPKLYNLARLRLLHKEKDKIKEAFLKRGVLRDRTVKLESKPENLKVPDAFPVYETVIKDLTEAKRISDDFDKGILTDVNVPNISMRYTAKRYGIHSYNLIYNDGPNANEACLKSNKIINKENLKDASFDNLDLVGDLWNLPLAIYTSRLNPRIKTQSGNFLAYSIFSRPICFEQSTERAQCEDDKKANPKTEYFNYLSLMKIQDYYRQVCEDALPFMMTVVIPKGEKKRLADYLAHVGINKYRIYPELDNLSLS